MHLVLAPGDWPWSSFRAHIGQAPTPAWLDTSGLHGFVLGRTVRHQRDRAAAAQRYRVMVAQAQPSDCSFWQEHLLGQIFLGDEDFAQRARAQLNDMSREQPEVPLAQRRAALSWAEWLQQAGGDRNRALLRAYREGTWTMTVLARETGLSVPHVSRIIARLDAVGGEKDKT